MTLGERMRLAFRVSGALALAGVLLFGGGGLALLWSSEFGTPTVARTAHPAGEPFPVPSGEAIAFWGRGDADLSAESVDCRPTSRDGEMEEPLQAGPPPGQEDLATIIDDELGTLVYLASDVHQGFGRSMMTCDGPGLDTVFTSADPRLPLHRGLGVALLVFAGVAGLWGWVALRTTRTRRAPAYGSTAHGPPPNHG